MKKWHKFCIKSEYYKDNGDSSYNNGLLLANEIKKFYRVELSKCQYRLIDEVYIDVLNRYKSVLMKEMSPDYYHQMLPVIAILESESYLKLCPNEEVRNLYLDSLKICSSLYNTYMSHVR